MTLPNYLLDKLRETRHAITKFSKSNDDKKRQVDPEEGSRPDNHMETQLGSDSGNDKGKSSRKIAIQGNERLPGDSGVEQGV